MSILEKADRLFDKFSKYLSLQILVALTFGVLAGIFFPAFAIKTKFIATVFVSIIEPFVAPVIFLTIVTLFGGLIDLKGAGRIGLKSFIYFELITTIAIVFGICSALLIRPGKMARAEFSSMLPENFTARVSSSWTSHLISSYTLYFLLAAIVIGLIINRSRHQTAAIGVLDYLRHMVFRILRYIFLFAPFAAFSGIAYTVGKFGADTLLPIGKLLAGTYIAVFIFIFAVLGGVLALYKVNMFSFLKAIKQELLWVLGTSSSTSVLPLLMDRLENMGYLRSVVGLVTVTGNSLNLTGTSLYMGMSVIFLAQLYNVTFSFSELLSVVLVIMVTSKGASGISGTGFIALATTVGTIHKIPVEGLAILLSIDRFMSEARAITNTIGHGVATVVISNSEKNNL
ncbi:cation:dicarboxylate symporter family transporter [Pedobacter sp. AW31-3R]|uniref:cation:dicarboxylate symporter family transporter n=1 Tax=Pedobacter sp. AW31-3R TaxID=3445781 RepID=UPI003FA0F153